MSAEKELREKIIAEIADHIRAHGPRNWAVIRNRYPDVIGGEAGSNEERKFFRWVKVAQNGKAPGARRAIAEARSEVSKNLPAPPPPEYLVRAGARGTKNIDFLAKLAEVAEDVELMRNYSSNFDADGVRSIKNPVFFDTSIKRRLDILETGLRITQEVWDLQRMEDFYGEIISIITDEILPIEPEIAKRIMFRLQALNDKRMMTVHARSGQD